MTEHGEDNVEIPQENENGAGEEQARKTREPADPVRKWTVIVLATSAILMLWYLISDRITPYTSQARAHALVVPVAPEISGLVTEINVQNNQLVDAGEILFTIDDTRYRLALENAQANLQKARQATGVSTANIDAAVAAVGAARAAMRRSEQDVTRLRRIKAQDAGAISERRLESAEAGLQVAREQFAAAEANVEKARQDLGDSGERNVRIVQAQSAVSQAELDLQHTRVIAPARGVVTDLRLDTGNFAAAGHPQMTFIGTQDVWVQADFTENNLGHIKRGDSVELIFDVLPGRVFKGTVRNAGFGVAVDSAPLGSLPTVKNNRSWLRDAQRFPVIVDFSLDIEEFRKMRVGAQASVIVYTGDNGLFNALGKLQMRISTLLSYAY